jgi:hypothetical protein
MTDRSLLLALASTVILGSAAGAQSTLRPSRFTPAVVAGVAQFDLSGTGNAPVFGARLDMDVSSWLLLEGSLEALRAKEQSGRTNTYYIPEAQLQVQVPGLAVRPYLGAGGGYFVGTNGRGTSGTASGSLGLRANVGDTPAVARAELRVRGIGSGFGGSTAEWTLGLGWRF